MTKLKSIKIEEDTFNKLKQYCDLNGLKIYKFVSNVISEKISEIDTKMSKMPKNNNI